MPDQQTQQTFELNAQKQLVVFVRHKAPSAGLGGELAAAGSMVDKVTSAVESATNAVESAMASIPGLNMIIKEDKKDTKADDKYKYFEDYSNWDKITDTTEDVLTDMNPNSKVHKFEYEAKNGDERKQDGQKLFNEVKSKISNWNENALLHFVGLSDGGNIVNECINQFADEAKIKDGKWTIKSITYVGTSLSKKDHELKKEVVKKTRITSFGNRYDLTQMSINYFEPNEKLIQQIKDSNKGTLSLFIGKIKMHMVQGLAYLLKGVHLGNSGSGQSPDQLYNGVKGEIEGMIQDVVGSAKQLIEEGLGLIKPGDLSGFKKIIDGYDQIPSQCVAELKNFFEDFKKLLKQRVEQIKTGETNLGISDLSNFLNCLCPLFDTLTASMKHFSYHEEGSKELVNQIIDGCGIKKVYTPSGASVKWLEIDKDLNEGAATAAANSQPDLSAVMVMQANSLLQDATKKTNDINAMNDDEKAKVAQAIFVMMTPMFASKIDFYKKLINAIPFNLGELMEAVNGNEYLKKITGPLEKIGIKTPDRLQQSVDAFDKEFKRIAGYVNKNNYKTQEKANSLYLIYNSHNLLLSKCWGDIHHCIDEQTGIIDYKKSQGYTNSFNTDENKYEKQGDAEIKNNVPAQKVKEETAV